ncbi:MAG TPA: sialate O-acetylesterase [Polyangiaceae bacterium]
MASSPYPPAVSQVTGITGFNTSNLLRTAALAGPQGNAAGFTIVVAFRVDTQVNGGNIVEFLDGVRGGRIYQDTATTLLGEYGNGVSAFIKAPPYRPAGGTGRATDVGRDQIVAFTYNAGYVHGWAGQIGESLQKVGKGTTTSAYVAPTTGTCRTCIGARQNGTAAHTGITIYSITQHTSPTNAKLYALADFFYANGRFPVTGDPELPAGTTNTYNFATDIANNGGTIPTTILDRVGSANMTFSLGNTTGFSVDTNTHDPVYTNVPPAASDLVIAAGDSMTDGRGDPADLATVFPAYPPTSGRVKMVKAKTGQPYFYENIAEPSGATVVTNACVGPFGMMTDLLSTQSSRGGRFANGGAGGTTSSQWVPGNAIYEAFRGQYEVAASSRNVTFRLLALYIGPNDANAAVSAASYNANLDALIADVTTILGAPPLIVQFQLTVAVPTAPLYTATSTEWNVIKGAIAGRAAANYLIVQSTTATREPQLLHHTTAENYTNAQAAVAVITTHGTWPWV